MSTLNATNTTSTASTLRSEREAPAIVRACQRHRSELRPGQSRLRPGIGLSILTENAAIQQAGIELGCGHESTPVVRVKIEFAESKHPRAQRAPYLRFVQTAENLAAWEGLAGHEHLVLVLAQRTPLNSCSEYATWGSCGCGYRLGQGGCLQGRTLEEHAASFLNRKFAHQRRQNKIEHRTGLVILIGG